MNITEYFTATISINFLKRMHNYLNSPKFTSYSIALKSYEIGLNLALKAVILKNLSPFIGWEGKENLVVSNCINQSRFERYATS